MAERRVAILNHFAVPLSAPGGTRHAELAGRLLGWQATIVAGNRNLLTRDRTSFDAAFRAVWVWPYSGNGPARILNWVSYAITSLAAGLRLGRIHLVYASSPHLLAGLSGWALARLRRVPFILEVRDLWPDVLVDMGTLTSSSPVLKVLRALEHFLYRRAARIVVLTSGSARRLAEIGVDESKIEVIPNGADPEDFDPPAARDDLRARFELDGFVVVYAGAHGPANGLDLVLDAAAELRVTAPDVTFLLVGDGVEKLRLQERARSEGLANVRFFDPVPKSDMPALLNAADAGLHALADVALFRYGVSPNKLYDYLAAGLPTITNTPGEVADIVRAAGAGVAVAPDAVGEGVRTIARATDAQRQGWGKSGRAWMAANRSRGARAARLEAVFDSLVPG